jgi:hypothetical protein
MLRDFQLGALVKSGGQWQLLRISLHQTLQITLADSWHQQYQAFVANIKEIPFDAGYTPEVDERFRVKNYALPEWLQAGVDGHLRKLDTISKHENLMDSIRAIVAFTRDSNGDDLMLAQSFSRSHVIEPGRFLFLQDDTFETPKRSGLTLGIHLVAVCYVKSQKLLFENYRNTNAFLPLTDFIADRQ